MLNIPHRQQLDDGYCLPACVQMILAFYGIERDQEQLAKLLGVVQGIGAPFSRVQNLTSRNLKIDFRTGELADLSALLDQGIPVIVRVMTEELLYWDIGTAHVVIVQALNADQVVLNDPAFVEPSFTVPTGDFELAWLAGDNSFASIVRVG